MATLILPSSIEHNDVDIADMQLVANERQPSTIDYDDNSQPSSPVLKNKRAQLKTVDQVFGPLQIGGYSITRRALDALGATVDGLPLNGDNTFFRTPGKRFINALQFDPAAIEARMKTTSGADDYLLPALLFELASRRPLTAPPLLNDSLDTFTDPAAYQAKLKKLLNSAQKLDIRHAHIEETLPNWVKRSTSRTMASTGIGLQAFGIYSGLRGLQDAIRDKDSYGIVFNSSAFTADVASIAVDLAVAHKATQMLKASESAFKGFAKTSFALKLGRGGGLIGGALTLPFDIISAVDGFKAAARTTGKEAINHYVNAGLSVTSATMTVLLGAAALAGFSSAGPIGLVAGLLLVAGSRVWAAINVVDDIDDYITLTTEERLRTGWFAFWGISPDESIEDRHLIAKSAAQHSTQLQNTARKLLDETLKDQTEAIVNGSFQVDIESLQVATYEWTRENPKYKTIKRPRISDTNDNIDASAGVTNDTPGAVLGTCADDKDILWFIGGGNDAIVGVEKKSNRFYYGAGHKNLVGGDNADEFVFEGAADLLKTGTDETLICELKGGAGNDTLKLAGDFPETNDDRYGFRVDLHKGEMSLLVKPPTRKERAYKPHTNLHGIENVETLAGATNEVVGSDGPNIIKSRGRDDIDAGAGEDQIYLLDRYASANGGAGKDAYAIAHVPGIVSIIEDGTDPSIIALDWRSDLIESWKIENRELVITSGFEFDDTSKKVVIIKNVYQQTADKRTLRNGKLTFITQDGFHFSPELPASIETAQPVDVEVVILRQGIRHLPVIVFDTECTVPHDKSSSYWVSRNKTKTVFRSGQPGKKIATSLHVDHASTELTCVEAHYNADLTYGTHFNYIMFKECGMTLHFGSKQISVKNLASSIRAGLRNLKPRLKAPELAFNHSFILIMNDGVSYRLVLPPAADNLFLSDTFEISGPMQWSSTVPLPLSPREGAHQYLQPLDNEAHTLGSREKCVKLNAAAQQTAVENLTGEGSKYLVHLSPGMSLRISTPDALATASRQLAFSSTWEFDASGLGSIDIRLVDNQLQIGQTIIYLPEYKNANDLIDQIRVITAQGIVWAVDLIFEAVYIDAIDARFLVPATDVSTPLPAELEQYTEDHILVRNIAMKDGSVGALRFHLTQRKWILDTDKSRDIDRKDLQTGNHCNHQLKLFQEVAQIALAYSPPLGEQALRTLRDQCVRLLGDLSLDYPAKLSKAKRLAWLLSGQSHYN
ncbi:MULTISPECIES: calcium-binding protein [Pseudomonas]|uniref:Calcium-binding protein n=1 Tax=Pseudomonas aphyarum TaxID=2942629 RepID=A0ABT5PWL0_9PSED|nr:calcium-binding protein [Pseudomonas aphyarum]MDD0971968.1 calcium-binding protein [Pseudomonas aphyarum]MDD1128150.1 calcium-binding protein [Pseudomonas aphyarum]